TGTILSGARPVLAQTAMSSEAATADPAGAGALASLRVAVVHDWLTGMRGGEKVLEAILEIVPQAEIFTLFHFEGSVSDLIEKGRVIHTSSLQRLAASVGNYRTLLPLFPRAAERWSFDSYDLVISSSHCVAKGVDTGNVPHVSYCHTPMRYIWDRFDDYFPVSRPFRRIAASTLAPALRRWDVGTAERVDRFVANSEFVRGRIRQYYVRDATVIHPFADDEWLEAPFEKGRDDFHLVLSALVPYKKIDLAIEAAVRSGRKLVIVGDGPMRYELTKRAPAGVELRGWVDPQELRRLTGRARSLIIPGVEDFGITALEAMASGTPVIGARTGGVRDSVVEGRTGVLFDTDRVESLVAAMRHVERTEWDRQLLRDRALQFDRSSFVASFWKVLIEEVERS
ncbi:MAG: glycosyltransferase, partial [Acidobacteria bacterium]|nr:glycosyltransferase [Acidobacteriota bacterium]